ncbi:hypothetical protein ACL02T_09655 [Pseudonocardia sp. RS010]|uniref:hypothetical protein n=1 Tax=Pseudonocardia sp. RS010 TaxID=3385979 RepID=UPI0039A0040B
MTDSTPPGPDPEHTGPASAPDGGPLNPPPSAAAAAALLEVRRMRDRLAELTETVAGLHGLPGRVDHYTELHQQLAATVSEDLAPGLAALREFTNAELARQDAQLEEVLAELRRERNSPVDWPALTEAQAREQWPVLGRWIAEIFVPWYEITRDELPDCWPLHRPALVELSWLRSAHVQAYLRSSPPSVAGEWHQRWRPGVVERLHAVIDRTLCGPGFHRLPEGERAAPAPPPLAPGGRVPLPPGRQLALPQHWQANYDRAVGEDLARRRQREAQG